MSYTSNNALIIHKYYMKWPVTSAFITTIKYFKVDGNQWCHTCI